MKIILIFLIIFFFINPVYADMTDYIDDYLNSYQSESYKKFSEVAKGNATISDIEKRLLIDREISDELGSNFIYLDLENCIKTALGENFDIRIRKENKNEAYWLNKNAQFSILPDIYYNFDIRYLTGEYLVGGIVATTAHEVPIQSLAVLEWSTINQGKYFFQNSITRNALKSQKAELEYTREEIILNTVLAYYDTLQKKMEIEVQKVNLYDRIEQLKYTKARFDSGLGTLYDVKRAQAELAGAQQDYTTTLNSLRLNQAALANIMGVDILDAIYPFEISVDRRVLVDPSFDIEALYNQALKSREDIRSKKAEISMYRAMRNMNYTDIIPEIKFSYQNGLVGTRRVGLSSHNSVIFDVRAHLGKNMLLGTITQMKADTAVLRAKKLELINLQRTVKENILNAFYDSENAIKKIEASKSETEAANHSVELSLANMKAGEATFIDVIASQNLKVKANINLITNMIEYNKAQSKLLFEIGLISVDSVLKDYQKKYY